ncbi:MAG: YitT family protein [Clostridia bacterium]|nr:YitT family protein [Clostridia bacterium]
MEELKNAISKKKSVLNELQRYFFMVLGCISYSLSLRVFLIPNEIVGGGVSGAASLIEMMTGLPAGLFIILINAPILIFGFKLMGWKFILNCFITTATLGGTTELLTVFGNMSITENKILAAAYGGILQGIGIGLFIKYEMSSGGTELLGRLTHHVVPFGSIATHVAIFDSLVVIVGALLKHNIENILHALILIFLSAKISDLIVFGFSKAKMCYIITEKAETIAEYLITHSPRGVTKVDGEGMYSKTEKGVLMTCIKSNQVVSLRSAIHLLDEDAFVIVCDANEVYGKGFNRI